MCIKLGKVNPETRLVSTVPSHMPLDSPETLFGTPHAYFVLACFAVLFA